LWGGIVARILRAMGELVRFPHERCPQPGIEENREAAPVLELRRRPRARFRLATVDGANVSFTFTTFGGNVPFELVNPADPEQPHGWFSPHGSRID
jgi:hypothetical protein